MNKKHFIIPSILIFLFISLIIFFLPIKTYNILSLIIIYISYFLYNIVSIIIISKNIENSLAKNISGLSIFYIYSVYNVLFIIELLLNKFIYINTYVSIIIVLLTLLTYILLLYFLINAKKYINKKEEEINEKTKNTNNWLTTIEIIISNIDDNENKKELNELYETLRYMDPISNDKVKDLDEKITKEIELLKENLNKENISKVKKLLNERKVLVKNNK